MGNHSNYLEYLYKNGGWFKVLTRDYNPLIVGYVSKVSLCAPRSFGYSFISPVVFSYSTKGLYPNVECIYDEAKNILGKPSIEDIELIKSELNKRCRKFNVKTKKMLLYHESN